MAKKTPPRTDFDLGDLIAAGYHQNRQQESASDEPLVGPQTQRIMDGMPAKERGVTGALKDTAVQLAEGANSVLGAIPSLVAPHSRAANFFEKNADYWREAQSDDIKSRTQAASAAIDAADEDGVIAQVVEAARQYSSDPALAARFVVTNLPSLIPGIGAAKVAQAASLAKSARAAGVATKALGIGAKAKAAAAATTAGGLVNAGLNAGGARGDAFTEVKQAAIESGMSEAEAEDLALSKSVMPAVVGGIAGFVSGKTGIERSLFGAGTKKSAAKAATASIVSEMGGEQLEELAPKLATNLQAGEIDGRSLSKDVGRTMVETAIGAGPSSLMAGGVEAIKAAQERKQAAVTSAQASGGIASRAGLAANGHATVPPAAPTQAPVAPVAQTDPSAPVILAQQEIAAMRSAPELDEAETRRLQFLEENLGDPKTLAELYGMEYNPPPDPAAPPAQPDQATPPEAPATPAGVSASGESSAGPQVDPTTGEILGAPVEDEPASAGEPPQAPMFDEQGQVVPEHDPLAGRTDEDLKTQRLNALSGKVKRTINDELKRRSESAPPEPESGELDVSDTAPWRRNIGKAKKLADQLGINHKGMKLPALTEAIERASGTRKADVAGDITGGKIDNDWSSFSEQSGTLGIPRSEMPQIKAEHRGAMVNFLKGKGIEATPETIPSRAIKPTQAEFSPEKVKSAMDFTGGDRAIIVSADGHVVDGHHQWLAKREKGEPIKALRLDTNIRDVLDALKGMPSAQPEQTAATPGTELAVSDESGESKQFTSYANWINDGEIISPGMREQIAADERLDEGEADRLLAMADERDTPQATIQDYRDAKAEALAVSKSAPREVIDPSADTQVGKNAAGEVLYDRNDGQRYAIRNGRPDFGGDLSPVDDVDTLNLPKAIRAVAKGAKRGDVIESLLHDKTDPGIARYYADDEQPTPGYALPDDVNRAWRDSDGRFVEHPSFQPNARQQALMNVVEKELDAGVFYNKELRDRVAKVLGVSEEVLASNRAGVDGGDFGYDVYYARRAVESKRAEMASKKTREELALKPGDKLGSLVFNDFKLTTGVEVISVSENGRRASFKGKRGAATVTFESTVEAIKFAIDRAQERGKRKDGYAEFVAKKNGVAPTVSTPDAVSRGAISRVIVNSVGRDGLTNAERQATDTKEETNGTEAPETIQAEAQGQEEPAPADAVSTAPDVDTSPDARWRKNWAAARDTAESLGLPTKDGKRSLKLTELVPAIEAKLKQPDSNNEATPSADTSNVIGESANDSIGKQILRAKKTVMRLRTLAKAGDLSLEQKLERKDAVKKAEEALRKMRQNVFSAEDAANAAISAKDASLFAEHKELFPSVYAELAKSIGNPVKASPPASAPTPTPTDAGAPVTSTTLDATNMTPIAVHEALMNGHKLSRHGETVWVGRKTTGTVDSYVVMSKEDDGNMVFTKGPVGASRDIGWGKSEAAGKAVASWDFDTIPVLEAQVAEQDAMLDSVLERLAQQGQVTDGRLEQRRADLEAELEKTRARIRDKKMLATSESVAINDFIEGRRDDAPTVDEVKAEQGANLESIFAGLQADGEAKSQAEQKAAASQFASRIEQVEANFHDALIALMEAGTLKVNGQSAITEDNRACL